METLKTELVDDGAKRDRRGRQLIPEDRRDALLREYDASGLTQAEFARRAGVKYPTFANWVQTRRAHGKRRLGGGSAVQFAEVSLPPAATATAALSVTLCDGMVVRGIDAAAVAALVRALRS